MPRSFNDLKIGDEFITREAQITEAEILDFARRFDPQPFHLDHDAGEASVFGGLVASGWHTASFAHELMMTDPGFDINGIGVGRRIQQLDWLKPVFPEDRLHVKITILDLKPPPKPGLMGRAVIRTETINHKGETVMRAQALIVLPERDGE
ncbi:MAG: MaoC family dehydratase [Alphaproteobacteria bacterium]